MKQKIYSIILLIMLVTTTIVSALPFDTKYITSAEQYYNVFFDEEGEAYVAARIDIYNRDKPAIEYLNIEMPGKSILLYKVVQENSYGFSEVEIKPARLSDSVYFTFDITPISSGQKSTILLFYKAEGYVKNTLGKYDFEFETLRLPYLTNNVKVSVDVQEGLELKGKKASVNYMPDFRVLGSIASFEASNMKSMSDSITRDVSFTKKANMLDPYESFSVKGVYAKNWLQMNIIWILIVAGIIILFLIMMIFVLLIKMIVR